MNGREDYLFELILKASEMGANELEIEYKGSMSFGVGNQIRAYPRQSKSC